jgi:nicotinate phosphoribosyltransferase
MRISAPLPEAQLVETALLAQIAFQTSVASRAARIVDAAAGRPVAEFGGRRAHGIEAGIVAARAAFLAGCDSTSNVEAGSRFGIPVSGTMAHSWVMAFPDEPSAFRRYTEVYGDRTVLLLDTYDTLGAARWVATSGLRPQAVRLDSGDVVALSKEVRTILDAAGLAGTAIFVSGDLDEWRIAEILDAGAPVDAFGVGAALSTSSDAPSLSAVYKLVEIGRAGEAVPMMKLSPGKETYPGAKQVWRVSGKSAVEDLLELADIKDAPSGRPLLKRVMRDGRRESPALTVSELRAGCRTAISELPAGVRRLRDPECYPVRVGEALQSTIERLSHPSRR